jgi:hypothetical protein
MNLYKPIRVELNLYELSLNLYELEFFVQPLFV